jgi:4-hydroxy-tetrahydrodipicolinate synthase
VAGLAIRGVVASVVTPFRRDERIDYSAWQRLLEANVAGGVNGILALGLPGESVALSDEERAVALRFCRQTIPARQAYVWGNVTCGSLRESLRLAAAAEIDGLDAIVVMPPAHPVLNEEEMEEFAGEVCRSVRIPVLIAVDPRWSPLRLSGGAMRRLFGACENFSGCLDGFPVDRGFDPQTTVPANDLQLVRALQGGAMAVVSECAGLAPRLVLELFKAVRAGREEDSHQLAALLEPVARQIHRHTYPAVLKLALESSGLGLAVCRRPVSEVPEPVRGELAPLFESIWARTGRPGAEVLSRA